MRRVRPPGRFLARPEQADTYLDDDVSSGIVMRGARGALELVTPFFTFKFKLLFLADSSIPHTGVIDITLCSLLFHLNLARLFPDRDAR